MKSLNKYVITLAIMFSILIIGMTAYAYIENDSLNWNYYLNTEKLGNFGGFIGGFVGTIISGITLYLVYITYNSQRKELEIQQDLIKTQQFETTFFNLLNTHRELKKDLNIHHDKINQTINPSDYGISKEILNGVEIFEEVNKFHKYLYDRTIRTILPVNEFFNITSTNPQLQETINEYKNLPEEEKSEPKALTFIYKHVFNRYQNQISHYCRNVYQILKFIRESEEKDTVTNKKEKFRKYANIFQSQLNVNEQGLLFYNFIDFDNDEKGIFSTLSLVNHYKFLENLGQTNLIHESHNNKTFYTFFVK